MGAMAPAAKQAVWTVGIAAVAIVLLTLLFEVVAGTARFSLEYLAHLGLSLGLRTVVWAIWVAAITIRFRAEPPRRRAQLATATGVVVAVIDGLITTFVSLADGGLEAVLGGAVPVLAGILVFAVSSGVGAYAAIPLSARKWRSR
jgi:hypothetical protein